MCTFRVCIIRECNERYDSLRHLANKKIYTAREVGLKSIPQCVPTKIAAGYWYILAKYIKKIIIQKKRPKVYLKLQGLSIIFSRLFKPSIWKRAFCN